MRGMREIELKQKKELKGYKIQFYFFVETEKAKVELPLNVNICFIK